jgi:uncharacterized protein HemX
VSPYLIIACLVAILAAGAGGFKLGVDHELASKAREDQQIAKAVDAANESAAQAIAQLKPKYTTIQNKLEKQIETHTVFRECRLDAVSLQLANQALEGGAVPAGNRQLPKADAPER